MNIINPEPSPAKGETATCPICGGSFEPDPDWYLRPRKQYCSRRCTNVARSRRASQRKRGVRTLMAQLKQLETVTSGMSWTPDGPMVYSTVAVGSKAKNPPNIRFVDVTFTPAEPD